MPVVKGNKGVALNPNFEQQIWRLMP